MAARGKLKQLRLTQKFTGEVAYIAYVIESSNTSYDVSLVCLLQFAGIAQHAHADRKSHSAGASHGGV